MLESRTIFESDEAVTSISLAEDDTILVAARRLIFATAEGGHSERTTWDDVVSAKPIGNDKLFVMRQPEGGDFVFYILGSTSGDGCHVLTNPGSNASEPVFCVDATGNVIFSQSVCGMGAEIEAISSFGVNTNFFHAWPSTWPAAWDRDGYENGSPTAICALSSGCVAIGDSDGIIFIADPVRGFLREFRAHGLSKKMNRIIRNRESSILYRSVGGVAPPQIEPVEGFISCLAMTRDGLLLSGSRDGTVRVWDPRVGEQIGPAFVHATPVTTLTPRGSDQFAAGTEDGALSLWNLRGEKLARLSAHKGDVTSLAVLPDGRIVSGGDDGAVIIWS